nr:unnamed protein product [Digitaria exilis]
MPAPPASRTTSPFWTRALTPRSHTTIFPATFSGESVPAMQRFPAVELDALAAETPVKFLPLPRETYAGKSRSSVPAPTVVIHGATLESVELPGPAFPAEQATRTPCSMAANAPMATLSRE